MQMFARHGNRWNVNELLSLQREYELLEWSVDKIALQHKRTVNAILFKLQEEGFISNWNEARGFESSISSSPTWKTAEEFLFEDENEDEEEEMDDCNDEDYVEEESCDEMDDDLFEEDESIEVAKLSQRVWTLEAAVSDISVMVKQIFDSMVSKKRPLASCH